MTGLGAPLTPVQGELPGLSLFVREQQGPKVVRCCCWRGRRWLRVYSERPGSDWHFAKRLQKL